jgi:TPR repeat protein
LGNTAPVWATKHKSGAIDGLEVATAWKQKLADETKVKELLAKTEGGDGDAMYVLGVWYEYGKNGLAIDKAQARAWYERSAAAGDIRGIGGSTDTSLGLVVITEAATKGSDYAAWVLGKAFFKGTSGLSKDPARARYWLKKIADGECAHKHLNNKAKATAAEWLRALDD